MRTITDDEATAEGRAKGHGWNVVGQYSTRPNRFRLAVLDRDNRVLVREAVGTWLILERPATSARFGGVTPAAPGVETPVPKRVDVAAAENRTNKE